MQTLKQMYAEPMDCPSEEKCLLGFDFDDNIKAQLGFIHLVLSKMCEAPVPGQSILELYLLKTFRDNSAFVHSESSNELEMKALHHFMHTRFEYIEEFLNITNANILQTNQEA